MAPPEPDERHAIATSPSRIDWGEQQDVAAVTSSQDGPQSTADNDVPNIPPVSEVEEPRVQSQPQDEVPTGSDTQTSMTESQTNVESAQADTEEYPKPPPDTALINRTPEGHTGGFPGFTFPRLDRRNLEMVGRRKEAQHFVTHTDEASTEQTSSPQKSGEPPQRHAQTCSSPLPAAEGDDAACRNSAESAPYGSDFSLTGYQMSTESHHYGQSSQHDPVQYQVDEQIHHEASMSDGLESYASSEAQTEDVICVGANSSRSPVDARSGFHKMPLGQTSRPLSRSTRPSGHSTSAALTRNLDAGRIYSRLSGPRSNLSSSAPVQNRQPSLRPQSRPQGRAAIPAPANPAPLPTDTKDLLDIVAYKFRQQEQKLQHAYSSDNKKIRFELHQACEENDSLRSQVVASEERCTQADIAIAKYRDQISKAKTLQKFLDGMGNDLLSLKRSYDHEKRMFVSRIEISEAEIARLEASLAGRVEFEGMLSHSKTLLENLLEAKGFELKSVIEHRDMLRSQLDERIGQLVEERDTRLGLEQLVGELRVNERASLKASVEQCTASLLSKLSTFNQKDDQLAIGVAAIQEAVQTLTERSVATPDDCDVIKAQVCDVGLDIAQSISMESSNSTTVADLSTSVDGIIQYHMQTLCTALDRMESKSCQTTTDEQAIALLQTELQGAADRSTRLESQLDAAMQNGVDLNNALAQSATRISELENRSTHDAASALNVISPEDVDHKVCNSTTCAVAIATDVTGQGSSGRGSETTIR